MVNTLFLPELREMLAEQDEAGLREFCIALHPAQTAEFMEGLSAAEAWAVLRYAESPLREEIFGFFSDERQREIIENSNPAEIASLIAELPADDRVDLLNEVPSEVVSEILPNVPKDERRDILRLQSYPEGTAGSVMTTDVAKFPETLTVIEALKLISRLQEEPETIYYNYIVDDDDRLLGIVSAKELVTHFGKPDTPISEIMERNVVTGRVTETQEEIAEKVAHYNFLAIPIVDDANHLLGIVTHDDVIDILREEATEDAHRLGAVEPLLTPYMRTHWAKLVWHRGMWLVILFAGALLTAFALQGYEADLARYSWLVLFIPLVISSGGNSGSQSSTLIITALTVGDVEHADWTRIIRRELLMGAVLGGFLGLIGYVPALMLTGSPVASLVVPVTILLVVICGTLTGSMLPLIFSRLGLDPALMSNPFVAGIIDIVGIVIYMNVALMVLG